MPQNQHTLQLSESELTQLRSLLRKGKHSSRTISRARALLLSHEGKIKKDIATELGIGESTVQLYREAEKTHFVLDNLNTHFETSFLETFGKREAKNILKRIQFHYTPKHASWLDMAEIEIGILDRQCIQRRIPTEEALTEKIRLWSEERNKQKKTIEWSFTVDLLPNTKIPLS